jgi:type I restriction enzyme R subunit
MTSLDPSIFNEANASQKRAVDMLRSMGWTYVPRAEADRKRRSPANVLFYDELEKFLSAQSYEYRGVMHPFSGASVGKAVRDLDAPLSGGLMAASKSVYDMLQVGRSYGETTPDGRSVSFDLPFIDWDRPERNVWQVTEEFQVERPDGSFSRPDIVLLVNGIPLAVIECKRAAVKVEEGIDQNVRNARPDFIPQLFKFVQIAVAANPADFRYATAGTPKEFYAKWREEDAERLSGMLKRHVPDGHPTAQDRGIASLFEKGRFLSLVRRYVVYDNGVKKIARYQQYFAVENILRRLLREDAAGTDGGVIWHAQGSGKSLTMTMLVKRVLSDSRFPNARFVLVCDRRGLVAQLRDNFVRVGLAPVRATTGAALSGLLADPGNTIVVTTLQKFRAANRRGVACRDPDVIVLVDEGHRSQGGLLHDFLFDCLPDAKKIGFTGTPLLKGTTTCGQFGPLVGRAYKFEDGIADDTIKPIVYEGRMAEQRLADRQIDEYFEDRIRDLPDERKEALRSEWSRFRRLSGTVSRLAMIAFDIHRHFLSWCKPRGFKALVAAGSRAAAIELQERINALGGVRATALVCADDVEREGDDEACSESDRRKIARFFAAGVKPRFGRNLDKWQEWVENELREGSGLDIVCVKDMLLTGFDAPPLAVLYVDKPMKDHSLLQAIARVNRKWPGKDFGLVVDYYGLFGKLNAALDLYSGAAAGREAALGCFDPDDLKEAIVEAGRRKRELLACHERVRAFFRELGAGTSGAAACMDLFSEEERPGDAARLRQEFCERFHALRRMTDLAVGSYSLYRAVGREKMDEIRNDVAFCSRLWESLKAVYGEKFDLAGYEDGIRNLLDGFVVSASVKRKIEPVFIHDAAAMAERIERIEGKKAKAAFIRTRLAAELELKRFEDPMRFKAFSRRIEETLDEYRRLRDENAYLAQMKKLADDYRSGFAGGDYPDLLAANEDARAFYGVLREEAAGWRTGRDAAFDDWLAELAVEIDKAVKDRARVDWHFNPSVHKSINQAVEDLVWDFCDGHGIQLSETMLDRLLESAMKTALARY